MTGEQERRTRNTRIKDPSGAPKDIAFGAAFWVVGLIVRFFPAYAGIEGMAENLYAVASVGCYAIGFLGVAVGVSKLKSSEFAKDGAVAFTLLTIALLIEIFFVSAAPTWLRLMLQHVMLVLVIFAVFGLAIGLSRLFDDHPHESDANLGEELDQTFADSNMNTGRWNTRSEFILGVIVAFLTLASVLLQAIAILLETNQ